MPPGACLAAFLAVIVACPSFALAEQFIQESGKNWEVNLNIGGSYSDNVKQNPGGSFNLFTDEEDSSFNWSGGGEYVHSFSDKLSLTGEYLVDQIIYSELSEYDALNNSWGLRPRYEITPDAFLDLQYFYIWSLADNESFSGVNYVGPVYSRLVGESGLLQVRLFYANSNNFQNDARDTDEFGGGFDYLYMFGDTPNYLGAGYQGSNQDTKGRFDRNKHDLSVKGLYVLPYKIRFRGQYKFSFHDYDTFASTGGGIREDVRHNYNFGFSKTFKKGWGFLQGATASVGWSRTTNDSNVLFREFTSNQTTFNLSTAF